MKFHPIWSRDSGELASDRQKTEGQTDGLTDEAATICLPFEWHENKRAMMACIAPLADT